jgi:hypothetical protein
MGFKSQYDYSKTSARRNSTADITITQSYKQSTKSEEMSLRVSNDLLKKVGIGIGDKVDVQWDDQNIWRIIKVDRFGYTITGKPDAPTLLIRYTLKKNHHKLTEDRADLPKREEFNHDEIEANAEQHSLTFCAIYGLI